MGSQWEPSTHKLFPNRQVLQVFEKLARCISSPNPHFFSMLNSLYNLPFDPISGEPYNLEIYRGKVLLIVNVASKCGFTRQYKNLEALHQRYQSQGLVVLGFPCDQFGGQEPGDNEEIESFCSLEYGVSFPMHSKIEVNGPDQHPIFGALTGPESPLSGKIRWNFNKFLVSREGVLLNRFGSLTSPESKKTVRAIEKALG